MMNSSQKDDMIKGNATITEEKMYELPYKHMTHFFLRIIVKELVNLNFRCRI